MNKSAVKFVTLDYNKFEAKSTLPLKFKRMLDTISFKNIVNGKSVIIKMHLGMDYSYTTIHPLFVKILVDTIRNAGGEIFITDLFVLRKNTENFAVRGAKNRGYSEEICGAPIIPIAGVFDKYYYSKKVDFKSLKEIQIAGHIYDADVLIDFSHVKGHGICAYGGACKNIAMGCVTRKTRLDLHTLEGGIIWKQESCIHCKKCIKACRYKANSFTNTGEYQISFHDCTYCQHCVEVCPNGALEFTGKKYEDFQTGMAISTQEILKTFEKNNVYYINVLMNITPICDCWGFSNPSIVPDIGILASNDLVSIEKASLDLIKTENLIPNSLPKDRKLREGEHLFEKIWGKDPYMQVSALEKRGIGNSNYEIELIK